MDIIHFIDSVLFSVLQSIVTIGAAIGGLLGGWMVDKIGRKLSLMFCALPYIFGFTIVIAAQNVWMLYLGRVLTGLASGVTSLVVPVSNMECLLLCYQLKLKVRGSYN